MPTCRQQFSNSANPAIHAATTAEELWNDTEGRIDALAAGWHRRHHHRLQRSVLKQRKPSFQAFAVEPTVVLFLSGGTPGPHRIRALAPALCPTTINPPSLMRSCKSMMPRRWRWDADWPALKAC